MLRRLFSVACLVFIVEVCLTFLLVCQPAQAASIDPYVTRYLRLKEPIALQVDQQGQTRLFSPEAISQGKQLFQQHCLSCHVGGATLPNPQVPLSLKALANATPPRDNINNLVAYFRQPMTYDGSEPNNWCREVPETWLSQDKVDDIAAFILVAGQKAPGWGTDRP